MQHSLVMQHLFSTPLYAALVMQHLYRVMSASPNNNDFTKIRNKRITTIPGYATYIMRR
uniref:Uncharacterized protein n=1 Tax=Picea glauca TaxID=3330 RepID=A0A101M0X7_PICGL|nr:hypothetical protein ABT39_MTgene4327 [Picea glauca]